MPLKLVGSFANQADHAHGGSVVAGLQFGSGHFVVEPVEVLPHFRADFLANLAGIFAGSADAFHDGERAFRIGHQQEHGGCGSTVVRKQRRERVT